MAEESLLGGGQVNIQVIKGERPDYIVIESGERFYEVIDLFIKKGKLVPKSLKNVEEVIEYHRLNVFSKAEAEGMVQGVVQGFKLGSLTPSSEANKVCYDCYGRPYSEQTSYQVKYCYITATPIGCNKFKVTANWVDCRLEKTFDRWEDALWEYDKLAKGTPIEDLKVSYLLGIGFEESN